jgi:hypothetical protein
MCMGAEAAWVPAVISAVGAGVSAKSQDDALKRQDREVARGIAARSAMQREAGSRVNQQISEIAKSNPDAERKAANDEFMAALRNAKVADGSLDIGGPAGASDRFTADVGQAREGAVGEGRALSGQLAAIDAPGRQRAREATGFTNAAVDLSRIESRTDGEDFLSQLRAAQAGRVNPLASGVGQGLSAFGSAYASRTKPQPKVAKPTRFLPGAP